MRRIFIVAVAFLLVISIAAATPVEKTPVIIGFKGQPDAVMVAGLGGDIKYNYHITNAIAAKLPPQAVDALRRNPKIAYVEEDVIVHAADAELDNSWGVGRIGAGVVHAYNKGTGIKVAIIDTGIDYNHPDLDDNYKGGYDYVNDDSDPMDDNGHGTHVAGTIGAEDNGIGVVGVAPEAYLYSLKVLDSGGSGYLSDVIAGIDWAVANNMQIISMSLGSDTDSQSLHDACDRAYAAGIIVVAAAGNDGNPAGKGDTVDYPGAYSSVIAVASTDNADKRAKSSSTGPAVELSAPGVDITSTWVGGGYNTISGTSMAAPHVSGAAALVLASAVDPTYDSDGDGAWDASEVREILQDTADDLGAVGKDDQYGYGLVDADEAAPEPLDVHDVAVIDVVADSWVLQGDLLPVNVTLANEGTYDETFTVTLVVDNATEIGSQEVTLAPGGSQTVTFTWNTTGAAIGDHVLEATASQIAGETDTADNSGILTVTVKEPSHDVAVTAITAPAQVGKGDAVDVYVDVANEGTYDETFTVRLVDTTEGVEIGVKTVTLTAGASKTVTFNWDTANSTLGDHILEAEAVAVDGETDTADNTMTATVSVIQKSALEVAVSTDKASYPTNSFAYITVKVTDTVGSAVEGAVVDVAVFYPDGSLSGTGTETTDSNGIVQIKYRIGPKDPTGTYTVTTDATKSGYDPGSGSTTFEVY